MELIEVAHDKSFIFRFITNPIGKVHREIGRFYRRTLARCWRTQAKSLPATLRVPSILVTLKPLETKYCSYAAKTPASPHTVESLAGKLREVMPQPGFVVALSQDNYLTVVGGVQRCVENEQRVFNQNQVGYIHFFPTNYRPMLARPAEPFYVSINCNGQWIAECPADFALEALKQLVQGISKKTLSHIVLHHLLGFKISWVQRLIEERGGGKALFWVHDYFALCPSYALMRNDIIFCNAPPVSSNSCEICIYGEERTSHLQAFHKLFNTVDLKVVTSSHHAEQMWKDKAGFRIAGSLTMPHCHIEWENGGRAPKSVAPVSPLRIAFLGLTMYHKGWETWRHIVRLFGSDPRYQFFHFAIKKDGSLPLTFVPVGACSKNRYAMLDALGKHNIDVAFLWSKCSETFSFTLHEAMAAGCYVVTNPDSGNIQRTVMQTNCGAVLASEEEAVAWFESDKLTRATREFQNRKARSGSIVLNPGSYKIIFETLQKVG